MTVSREDILNIAGEALEFMQTTSVDGRNYIAIDDLLELIRSNRDAILDVVEANLDSGLLTEGQIIAMNMKVDGMASILAQIAGVLIAADDRESIGSLSPSDFT
jgi:hypothetical protein